LLSLKSSMVLPSRMASKRPKASLRIFLLISVLLARISNQLSWAQSPGNSQDEKDDDSHNTIPNYSSLRLSGKKKAYTLSTCAKTVYH
jgi:hypothetical protein